MNEVPYKVFLSDEQVKRIEQLVSQQLTLDQRYAQYGREFGFGAAGGSPISRAVEAIERRRGDLQRLLCKDNKFSQIAASTETAVSLALAFAIAGKLVNEQFESVDNMQLSVLLAHLGLAWLCQDVKP